MPCIISNEKLMKEIVIISEIVDDAVIDYINAKDEPDVVLKIWSHIFDIVCQFSSAGNHNINYDCVVALATINTNQHLFGTW